jgi:hypothetical protein
MSDIREMGSIDWVLIDAHGGQAVEPREAEQTTNSDHRCLEGVDCG